MIHGWSRWRHRTRMPDSQTKVLPGQEKLCAIIKKQEYKTPSNDVHLTMNKENQSIYIEGANN